MTKTQRMRALINGERICISPGVYDGYSVRLVQQMGYETASTTGAGLSNSRLGKSESIGIMSMLENVAACRALADAVDIPLMADADTGYGNAVTVFHAVRAFEDAGVVGINIEDQTYPKRCGHYVGKELIDAREMAGKIEAAVDARRDDDFILVARTDAIAVEGLDKAIERARLYAAAGADMIFPDAVRSEDQIKRFLDEVPASLSINMGLGIRSRATTPLIPLSKLEAMGVARVSLPRMLPAAAIAGMRQALTLMKDSIESGIVMDRKDLLVGVEEIMELIGDNDVNALEQRYLLPEQLQKKYHPHG
ncbi:MAG: isocitrate lyase/PEP mutase family protein [Castellaniella sp.]